MPTKTDKTLKEAQTRYKKHFAESERNLPTISPVDYVYLDRWPSLKTAAERMAGEPRSKLLPKAADPFRVTDLTSHTITIDEDGLSNIIPIYRATPTTRAKTAPQSNRQYPTHKATTILATQPLRWHETRCIQPEKTHHQHGKLRIVLIYTSSIISSDTSTQKTASAT